MKKVKLLLNEEIKRIVELNGNNFLNGKHLVIVDVQPAYESYIDFLPSLIKTLNNSAQSLSRLTFLFNGESMGYGDENELKYWFIENGLDEDIIDNANYYDKGYAFFRYCMDSNIEEENIVNLIKFMMINNINDTRDIDEEFWDKFMEQYGHEDVRELLELADDCVNIPDLMDELKEYLSDNINQFKNFTKLDNFIAEFPSISLQVDLN